MEVVDINNKVSHMNFIVSSASLLKQLQAISGVLNSSNTVPILDNFLFNIQENSLTISASDLETTMITSLKIEAKNPGMVAIPAKLLLEILKTFPDHPLNFMIDPNNFAIEISSDYGKYKLSGQNSKEFPKLPNLESTSTITLPTELVQRAIEKTIFATGNDELRPVMGGIFCQLEQERITFAATDAHKLVRYRRNDVGSEGFSSFILPKKPMNLVKNLLGHSNDVTLTYNEANVRFDFENFTVVCRLVEGKYPNYEAVIPTDNPCALTIDRVSFAHSLKRISIFANKTTYQVRLKITGSELTLSAEDVDFSNEASERLTCSYNGDDMEIGFNSKFLLEMLNNMDTETIILELSAPNRAGILLPETPDSPGEEILMLVMPVMLNN